MRLPLTQLDVCVWQVGSQDDFQWCQRRHETHLTYTTGHLTQAGQPVQWWSTSKRRLMRCGITRPGKVPRCLRPGYGSFGGAAPSTCSTRSCAVGHGRRRGGLVARDHAPGVRRAGGRPAPPDSTTYEAICELYGWPDARRSGSRIRGSLDRMREMNWTRIAVGVALVLGGGAGALVLKGTSLGWPVAGLGVVLILVGAFPTFSVRHAAWALVLILGLLLLITGISGFWVVGGVDLSAFVVMGGLGCRAGRRHRREQRQGLTSGTASAHSFKQSGETDTANSWTHHLRKSGSASCTGGRTRGARAASRRASPA